MIPIIVASAGLLTFGALCMIFDDGKEQLDFPPSYYDKLKKEHLEKHGKNYIDHYIELGFGHIGCFCRNSIKDIIFTENYTEVYLETTGECYSGIEAAIPKMEKDTGYSIQWENIEYSNLVKFTFFFKSLPNLDFRIIKLSPFEVIVGHDERGGNIIASMKLTPHMLFSGLSGRGKTGCVRGLIKNILLNNNADVVLLNGYADNYKDINVKHIITHDDIKYFLRPLVAEAEKGVVRGRPLYLCIEELGNIEDKDLIKYITKLLQYGRHSDIFIIGIIPQATKEDVKFKSLFNTRVSFAQIEESSYRVILGCTVPKLILQNREFYMVSDNFYFGKTYTL